MKAKLILENGMIFEGKAFGYLKDSIGEVSGEYIIPYPPGISLTSPGEIITKEVIWEQKILSAIITYPIMNALPKFSTTPFWAAEN